MKNVKKATDLTKEIKNASGEQSEGIGQVSNAIQQMDQLTQQNAASSEETAAASEELSAQSQSLMGQVKILAAQVGGGVGNVYDARGESLERTVPARWKDEELGQEKGDEGDEEHVPHQASRNRISSLDKNKIPEHAEVLKDS